HEWARVRAPAKPEIPAPTMATLKNLGSWWNEANGTNGADGQGASNCRGLLAPYIDPSLVPLCLFYRTFVWTLAEPELPTTPYRQQFILKSGRIARTDLSNP